GCGHLAMGSSKRSEARSADLRAKGHPAELSRRDRMAQQLHFLLLWVFVGYQSSRRSTSDEEGNHSAVPGLSQNSRTRRPCGGRLEEKARLRSATGGRWEGRVHSLGGRRGGIQ